jgi:hypothetical protein
MDIEQYKLLTPRRIAQNNLLWQTPTLASAAQAFLISSAIGPQSQGILPIALAALSVFVGFAALQLLARHRLLLINDSKLLEKFERENVKKGYLVIHGTFTSRELPDNWLDKFIFWIGKFRSSLIWMFVLAGFVLLGCIVAVRAILLVIR